jgi:hypothetical protein
MSWQRIWEELKQSPEKLDSLEWKLKHFNAMVLRERYATLRNESAPPLSLTGHEVSVYSQSGEDGILLEIFLQIGVTNRCCVEFGIGDGTECNTANLLLNFGWTGLLMDSEDSKIAAAQQFYRQQLGSRASNATLAQHRLTAGNINSVLIEHNVSGPIELLSIDIDSNDYWVWRAINVIQPRVVVIEYNAALGAEKALTMKYTPEFRNQSWVNFGASLAALTKLGREKGYVLVGCESRGVNAFFVRADCAAGKLAEVSASDAYRPHWWLARLANKGIAQPEALRSDGFFVEV